VSVTEPFAASPADPPVDAERRRSTRSYGSVILDQAWASRLGVQRVGGVYRITHRELQQRLAQVQARPAGKPAPLPQPPRKLLSWIWPGTRAS
jgi:hypothetical protein